MALSEKTQREMEAGRKALEAHKQARAAAVPDAVVPVEPAAPSPPPSLKGKK